MAKIIRLKLYQPFAHYREPKIMQDDYIPTLPLPSATTIAGMVSYMMGRKLNKIIDVAITGKYQKKEINFVRGENIDFWENYNKSFNSKILYSTEDTKEILMKYYNVSEEELKGLNKSKIDKIKKDKEEELKIQKIKNGENFIWYKTKIAKNRIMNFEILSEVELTIYLKITDEEDYKDIMCAFEEISYYMALGRKEDFAVFPRGEKIEDITDFVVEKEMTIEESIQNNAKLQNTYIEVDLNNKNDEYFLNQGVLFSLPLRYKDIRDDKTERKIEHAHFVYIDERGIYPKKKKTNVYKKENLTESFCWMVGI